MELLVERIVILPDLRSAAVMPHHVSIHRLPAAQPLARFSALIMVNKQRFDWFSEISKRSGADGLPAARGHKMLTVWLNNLQWTSC